MLFFFFFLLNDMNLQVKLRNLEVKNMPKKWEFGLRKVLIKAEMDNFK